MLPNDNGILVNFEISNEWTYRGEGNGNVVISFPKCRKILRIRKTERPRSLIRWLIIWISDFLYWYCGKGMKEELSDMQFYSTVMRPLLGQKYTSEAHQVILSRKQVRYFEDQLNKFRPDFRKNKILQYGRASLFDDFAFISQDEYDFLPFDLSEDVFAIEIKPKQGWRPLSEKHYPACLFCMNQYLKIEKRQIKMISKYCPEDLFSGNDNRMKFAIKSLIEVPQNNFKIFKNGILMYGEKANKGFYTILEQLFETSNISLEKLQDEFCEMITKCLLTNLINVDFLEGCEKKLFCKWNKIIQGLNGSNCLPEGSILEKILSIQMLDTEGSDYYNRMLNGENEKDWDYVEMFLDRVNKDSACLKCTIMMLGDTDRREELKDLAFVPYLISAIAKDCSLMITLKKINEDVSDDLEIKNIIRTQFGHFLINIGVFDLYPKPLSTIRKHCRRNKDIFDAYMRATTK